MHANTLIIEKYVEDYVIPFMGVIKTNNYSYYYVHHEAFHLLRSFH